MGAKGQAYRKRLQARREADSKKMTGEITSVLFSPKLCDACEWLSENPGQNPELEKAINNVLNGLMRLNLALEAANRANDKRRARFKVVKRLPKPLRSTL